MKFCEVCLVKLRIDNNIGTCRAHRALSKSRKLYMSKYYDSNRDKISNYKRYWKLANKDRLNQQFYDRLKSDPIFKLRHSLRTRLNRALDQNKKAKSITKLIGCSIQDLKIYLESKFKEGMSWENHGKWHIDHIVPLSNFDLTNSEQLSKACNFSNLQPLWAEENLKKGNRI